MREAGSCDTIPPRTSARLRALLILVFLMAYELLQPENTGPTPHSEPEPPPSPRRSGRPQALPKTPKQRLEGLLVVHSQPHLERLRSLGTGIRASNQVSYLLGDGCSSRGPEWTLPSASARDMSSRRPDAPAKPKCSSSTNPKAGRGRCTRTVDAQVGRRASNCNDAKPKSSNAASHMCAQRMARDVCGSAA